MSNLVKFMMMVIALAFLAFLNTRTLPAVHGETIHGLALQRESKLPV